MAIRLLALDLDGTLLNARGEVSERNRRAINAARERDVKVAIVTGRRFRDARPLALDLGLDDVPIISHNGALTKHAITLEVVEALMLSLESSREVLRIGREFKSDALVSDDAVGAGVLVFDNLSDDNAPLRKYIAWARRIHGDEADHAVRRVESLEAYLDHAPVHIAYSGGCEMISVLKEAIDRELGSSVKLLTTMYPKLDFALLDILNPAASKGEGVAAAANELGFTREEVMACGDNFNDLEMLQFAGTSVLMANAQPEMNELLKDNVRVHITSSNEEDGVALAIEKFILESE
jgi:hypothetical protein